MKKKNITFRDFIKNIGAFQEGALYAKSQIKSVQDNLIVIYDDPYWDADDFDGCKRLIWLFQVEEIVENLQSQNPNPTMDDYIEAINYYIENDAFIDVENRDNKPQGGFKIWG